MLEQKLGWLNWFLQFHCEGLSSFNPTRFYYSYTWSCSLFERRTPLCTILISRKLCVFLLMLAYVILALLHSVFYFFFLYRSSLLLWTVFDPISLDEILLTNSSANVFVFGNFNVHHKDSLTYSGGTDRPGELCWNFSISYDFTQIVNFPTQIPDCDSHSPALLELFLSPDASICSTMAFPQLENYDHVSVSIDFPINSKQDAPFHCIAYNYSRAD